MENLMFYVLEGLLKCGRIVPYEYQVAGEDAWRIEVECDGSYVHSWSFLRSEIRVIRDSYELRKAYMYDDECKLIERLISVL